MPVEIRTITDEELVAFHFIEGVAFGHVDVSDEALAYERNVLELDRTIAGFDGPDLVSTAAAFSFEMTVPGGGTVPVAGVTAVTVLATHRRQGILRAMMAHQLDDVAARGEPIAILNASEAAIYGRFGYGLAQFFQSWKLDTVRCAFRSPVRDDLPLRLMSTAEAAQIVPAIYDAWRPTRPGALSHSAGWWKCFFGDFKGWRGGGKVFVVVCDPDPASGRGGGFCVYTVDNSPHSGSWRLDVREIVASDAEVSARLWRFLLDVDLVSTVTAMVVPVDDPLRWMLADPRQVRTNGVADFVYVRILDVVAALDARQYAVDDTVVLDVRDAFRPEVSGCYRVTTTGGVARTEQVGDAVEADLELGITELGSLYLGGVHARDVATAGGIVERTPGALARVDALFTWPVAPFCITRF